MRVSDFSRLEGLLHFTETGPDAGLRLEFYHKESVLNVFGSNLREAPIPLDRLGSVERKQGWFSDKLTIRFKSLSDAEAIPGATMGQITLTTKKKEREKLIEIALDLDLALAQLRLDQLESTREN